MDGRRQTGDGAPAGIPFPWAERFLYVPSIAACLAAAWGFGEAAGVSRRRAFPVLGVALAVGLGARSFVGAEEWRGQRRPLAAAVRDPPEWSPGRASHGTAPAADGDRRGAEEANVEIRSKR